MSEEEYEKMIGAMMDRMAGVKIDGLHLEQLIPANELRDLARAAAEAIGLKPGMVIAPAEPTAGMLVDAHRKCQYAQMLVYGDYEAVYKTMIAARPQPASAG